MNPCVSVEPSNKIFNPQPLLSKLPKISKICISEFVCTIFPSPYQELILHCQIYFNTLYQRSAHPVSPPPEFDIMSAPAGKTAFDDVDTSYNPRGIQHSIEGNGRTPFNPFTQRHLQHLRIAPPPLSAQTGPTCPASQPSRRPSNSGSA